MALSPADITIAVMTDSYKATHYLQYPESKCMVAYGEFRAPFENNKEDSRFVFYGIRYIVQTYLERKWTVEDVEKAEHFYSTHMPGGTPFPFPKDLFLKFIKENDGYFPLKLEAIPEGSVVHIHTPVYQMTAYGEYSRLCTFFETILTQVWYPTCVATLSRMTKELIEESFEKSVDEEFFGLVNSRLHDFGFRGCTCVEQSVIGGAAHLLNFEGSDTLSAGYYVQYALNNGKPLATSIPASEHSVMTSWKTEREAISNMIKHFGSGPFSTVLDSYDYERALNKVVPSLAAEHKKKGGFWVFRPDSGDPVEAIMMALRAGENAFGTTTNKKGYKVINGAGCLQGDGINKAVVVKIIEKALAEGYSAQNIVYGMGGGLLQKVNRDTMSFATKLSYIEYADGRKRDVMKLPKTDAGKVSLPGILRVKKNPQTGLESVLPRESDNGKYDADDILKPVYDHKPLAGVWEDFTTIRNRVQEQWKKSPKHHDPISAELKSKISVWVAAQRELLASDQL
eukprot:TRINITY_DN1949_c0_g1_i3.p1 TRINITY_DN1949_c0_g1~~TRINITY_DN1949_c0_g1_i3.p1  ORF type:complete len:532 (-),score=140.66 TRINITY_DN1949_c0_g1_i3:48-1580(-)